MALSRRTFLRAFLGSAPALVVPPAISIGFLQKAWNWWLKRRVTSDTVGAFPIRQDITVLPADDPRKLRLGWVIREEVGIVVVNDYAISNVTL